MRFDAAPQFYFHSNLAAINLANNLRSSFAKTKINIPPKLELLLSDYEHDKVVLGQTINKNGKVHSIEDWLFRVMSFFATCFKDIPAGGEVLQPSDATPALVKALRMHIAAVLEIAAKNMSPDKVKAMEEKFLKQQRTSLEQERMLEQIQKESAELAARHAALEKEKQALEVQLKEQEDRAKQADATQQKQIETFQSQVSDQAKLIEQLQQALERAKMTSAPSVAKAPNNTDADVKVGTEEDLQGRNWDLQSTRSVKQANPKDIYAQRGNASHFLSPIMVLLIDLRWLTSATFKVRDPNLTFRFPAEVLGDFISDRSSLKVAAKLQGLTVKSAVTHEVTLAQLLDITHLQFPACAPKDRDFYDLLAFLVGAELLPVSALRSKEAFTSFLQTAPQTLADTLNRFYADFVRTGLSSFLDALGKAIPAFFECDPYYHLGVPTKEQIGTMADGKEAFDMALKMKFLKDYFKGTRYVGVGTKDTAHLNFMAAYEEKLKLLATRVQTIQQSAKPSKSSSSLVSGSLMKAPRAQVQASLPTVDESDASSTVGMKNQ